MDMYPFLGAIYYDNQWFLRADDNRYAWVLDLSNAPSREIVLSRKNSIIATNNIREYIDSFAIHLEHEEARNTIDLPSLSFVVDFEKKLFIDGNSEESYWIPVDQYMINEWKYYMHSPYLYIPESIVELLLKKRLNSDNTIEIPHILHAITIAGIKYHGTWRFFFHLRFMWQLDMSWKLDDEYGNWRQDLPIITDENTELYLSKLQPYELFIHELPYTTYHMTDIHKFLVEEMTEFAIDEEIPEVKIRKFEEANNYNKLTLSVIIDFDSHNYIIKHPYSLRPKEKVDVQVVHVTKGWDCYWGNPAEALPNHLRKFWK